MLLQATKLLRKNRDTLMTARLGKKMLDPEQQGALQALLFHVTFWHLNLGYFDRNPIESWPQNDVGVVLWSLSASANDWLPPEKLTRLLLGPDARRVESALISGRSLWKRVSCGLCCGLDCWKASPRARQASRYLICTGRSHCSDRCLKFNVKIERPAMRH